MIWQTCPQWMKVMPTDGLFVFVLMVWSLMLGDRCKVSADIAEGFKSDVTSKPSIATGTGKLPIINALPDLNTRDFRMQFIGATIAITDYLCAILASASRGCDVERVGHTRNKARAETNCQ